MDMMEETQIAKGQRTKRQRPYSPSFTITTSSSSGSIGHTHVSTSTEEEEDMANCLILLAQGHNGHKTHKVHSNTNISDGYEFTENLRSGIYAYECKTCNKCFGSFQALGGHRASHKKLKAAAEAASAAALDVVAGEDHKKALVLYEDHHSSVLMGNRVFYTTSNNKSKIHECSICGSEFSSGQALGGHMRRHRTVTITATASADIAPIMMEPQEPARIRNVLALDLNLPAPEEDHREAKFSFVTKQQQQPLRFSTSSLVDCHY
ncbi:hypothetical protein GIB67_017191 [Kingdonia uniflora]|uniref:C2H2-type domain-containing protein n=1 Tax=Kingdonia uniflora TaxID=39325 RepID=A0A7J7NKP3_9MAGN|nr:hypothetical protein GIB67_017191 [Kingdonia uniflora]